MSPTVPNQITEEQRAFELTQPIQCSGRMTYTELRKLNRQYQLSYFFLGMAVLYLIRLYASAPGPLGGLPEISLPSLLLIGLTVLMVRVDFTNMQKAKRQSKSGEGMYREARYTITNEAIQLETDISSTTIKWSGFRTFTMTEDALILHYLDGPHFNVLFRSWFDNENAWNDVCSLAQSRLLSTQR